MQTWVYEKLRSKGISQAELARQLGIVPLSLCRKFNGKTPFLYNEVIEICRILDIGNPLEYEWGKK